MHLQDLRPKTEIDLPQLSGLIGGKGWLAGVPSALPDDVLLSLATDFSLIEVIWDNGFTRPSTPHPASFARALYVVTNLVAKYREHLGQLSYSAPVEDVLNAMRVYQWGIEHEVTARITGCSTEQRAEEFAKAICKCLSLDAS